MDRFLEICKVPRSTYNNDNIRNHLIEFAKSHGLPYEVDNGGNLCIDHPGMFHTKTILQAHTDMVAVTRKESLHDWKRDPLIPYISGNMLYALDTSLGADDGAGLAILLNMLESPELKDLGFRCIFTVDEEVGVIGAKNLDRKWLDGFRYLINVDSEAYDTVVIGCNGGTEIVAEYTPETEKADGDCYIMKISGLKGGHSAIVIEKNMPFINSIKFAFGLLDMIDDIRISDVNGGDFRNSIPNWTEVRFTVPFGTDIAGIEETFRKKIDDEIIAASIDTGIKFCIEKSNTDTTWTRKSTSDFINAVCSTPNGLIEKEEGYMVSSNLGIIRCENGKCSTNFYLRSPKGSGFNSDRIISIYSEIGSETKIVNSYNGWKENMNSELLSITEKIFKGLTGKEMRVYVTHAGLECAIFKEFNNDIEQIAIGPDIYHAHSVNEHMDIRTYHFMKRMISELLIEISKQIG